MDAVVPKELDFSEFCLKNNPKSYGAWYHRYWLMKETDFKKVAEELKLCSKYLEYDDRNCKYLFHLEIFCTSWF
jgi:geranylgeranyl transferase type-2 subunit alpha